MAPCKVQKISVLLTIAVLFENNLHLFIAFTISKCNM
jgi:hypothetical protein